MWRIDIGCHSRAQKRLGQSTLRTRVHAWLMSHLKRRGRVSWA